MKNNDPNSIHYVESAYNWLDVSSVFLAFLNTQPCFAGFCDWRLPSFSELLTLVDYTRINPARTHPDNTNDSPIVWTSTPLAGDDGSSGFLTVWAVEFSYGRTDVILALPITQFSGLPVRAVRGSCCRGCCPLFFDSLLGLPVIHE